MNFRSLRALPLALLLLALPATFLSAQSIPTDRTFATSPGLNTEIKLLIRLLEEAHYNREAVKPVDYSEVIPNYMSDWDAQRIFFLDADRVEFERRFSEGLYWNVASLGRIDAAYEIFETYEKRVHARINWIFNELEREFDYETQQTYTVDRSKADWPTTADEADDLWRRRLKFELVQEKLADTSPEEAVTNVRKRYERLLKNLADIETTDLAEMFLSNVTKLFDPHSTYFSAATFEDFSIQMRLQLVGIGALLGLEEDYCVVKDIIAGGPADLDSRLKPNDRIIAVGQMDAEPIEVIGMKLRKIVEMIRGNKGSQVRLIVQPADAVDRSVRREIVITRNIVNLDSARARAAVFDVPDHEGIIRPMGVISLPTFYATDEHSATKDVKALISQLKEKNVQSLVLDLRNNGGGLLSEAIELTGLFISKGPVVQVRDYFGEVKVDSDRDEGIAYSGPLAVLVSRYSASASEIVAGALQNYGRAIVIGDSSTHGKGTVQTVVEMANVMGRQRIASEPTGAVKLTIQKFYLPNGASTQLKGVVPDIILPSPDDYLPIGERDLPHALVWDEIPSTFFDGEPLDSDLLSNLREASLARQQSLDEFDYLKRNIDWFRIRQEEKTYSLNLEERLNQKKADLAFKDEMDAERERLSENSFDYREFLLGTPPIPKIAAKPPADPADSAEPADGEVVEEEEEEPEGYARFDIQLREALRVLSDALELARNPQFAAEQAPLTAQSSKRG